MRCSVGSDARHAYGGGVNEAAVQRRAQLQRERAAGLGVRVAEWLGPLTGVERALDSGCGTGALAFALASGVGSVVGVDADSASIAVAQARAPANVELRVDDATQLPFADATFDLAGCLRVLHHVETPDRVVAELARVARVGARVLVVDQLRDADPVVAEANERFERARDAGHARLLGRGEIEAMMLAAGLELERDETVAEQIDTEVFLDLVGLDGDDRARVRTLAPGESYTIEVGWFLGRRRP